MRLPVFVSLSVVSKITQKRVDGFGRTFACRQMSGHRGSTLDLIAGLSARQLRLSAPWRREDVGNYLTFEPDLYHSPDPGTGFTLDIEF